MWTLPDLANSLILLQWTSKDQPIHTHTHTHTYTCIHNGAHVIAIQPPPTPKHQKEKSCRKRMLQDLIKNYSNYSWMRRTNPRSLLPLPSPGALELFVAASKIQKLPWERTSGRGFLSFFLSFRSWNCRRQFLGSVVTYPSLSLSSRRDTYGHFQRARTTPFLSFFLSLSLSLPRRGIPSTHNCYSLVLIKTLKPFCLYPDARPVPTI